MRDVPPADRQSDPVALRALCALVALAVAAVVPYAFSPSPERIARAKALGIVSVTTLAGYDPGRDLRAYMAALAIGCAAGCALWWLLSGRKLGRAPGAPEDPRRRWSWTELGIVVLVLAPGLLRFDLAVNGWDAHYTFFAEEGQVMAWARAVLHGGMLGRDIYCPYGPLAILPVAGIFAAGGSSVWLGRITFYALQIPALLFGYVLLRELARSRAAALCGLFLLTCLRMWPMPGISWMLLRVGWGLGAFALLARALRSGSRWTLAAAGIALGLGAATDPAAGTAAAIGAAVAIAIADGGGRERLRRGAIVAAGAAVALLPIAVWFASRGAFADLVASLAGFSRLRMLGHGAFPFPDVPALAAAWARGPSAGAWEALRDGLGVLSGPAVVLVASVDGGTRLLRGERGARLAVEAGLCAYGAALFVATLSRPDVTNVARALPPAIVLAVLLGERAFAALARSRRALDRVAAAFALACLLAGGVAVEAYTVENVEIFVRQWGRDLRLSPVSPPEEGMRALDLPRGGGVRIPEERAAELEQVVRYLEANTRPGEPVWCFPAEPMIAFLADRPVAGRYPVALFAITTAQRREQIDEVERAGVRYAVVNTRPIAVDGIPSQRAVPDLWLYVDLHFETVARFGRYEIRRSSETAAPRAGTASSAPPAR